MFIGLCALKYAFNNGTGWYNYTIDSSIDAGQFTSIAIDANDEPHISYSTGSQTEVCLAERDDLVYAGCGQHPNCVDID